MRYYFSRDLNRLTTGLNHIPLSDVASFIRGDSASIELQIYSGQDGLVTIEELHDYTIRFGVRPLDKYREDTAPPIVLTSDWEWLPIEQVYRAYPSFSGELIDELFPAAEDLSSPASVSLHAEIEIITSSPYSRTTIQIGEITLLNDILQGDESEPAPEVASDYLLKSEASAKYLRFDEAATLSPEEQDNVLTAIGAPASADLVLLTEQELTLEQKEQVATNLGYSLEAISAVRYTVQTLTSEQQAQARANIGDPPTSDDLDTRLAALGANVLRSTAQTLTGGQKTQVLTNIGAAAVNHTHADRPALYRRWITFEPEGNNTTIVLTGAKHTASGTATARTVSLFKAGITVASIDAFTSVITAPGHNLLHGEYVQFTAAAFPSPLAADTWYQVGVLSSSTLQVYEYPGADLVVFASETFTTLKITAQAHVLDRTRRIGFVSAATANAAAGTRHAAAQWLRHDPPLYLGGTPYDEVHDTRAWRYTAIFAISDAAAVANARLFVGMAANTTAMPSANPSTFTDAFGIGQDSGSSYAKVVGGFVTGGNTTGLQLVTGRPYKLTIERNYAGETTGNLVALYAVDADNSIPYMMGFHGDRTTTKLLCPHIWRSNGSTTLAVGIDVIHWSIDADY